MDVTIVVTHQGEGWKTNNIHRAIKEVNKKGYMVIFKEQPIIRAMCLSRNIGVELLDCDYFMQTDDDVIFSSGTGCYPYSSGERFYQCIQYLKKFPKCGFVMCAGSLGGNIQKMEISSTKSGLFATQRGLIYRYLPDHNYYGKAINNIGSCEDAIITYRLLEKGYYGAKQFNNPTIHRTTLGKGGKIFNKETQGEFLHDREVLKKNNMKYIQERYSDTSWTPSSKKIPEGLKRMYLNSGGDPDIFKMRKYKLNF